MYGQKFTVRKDAVDHRDYKFGDQFSAVDLPTKIDLRNLFAKPYNQGNLNSCTANAIGAAFQFDQQKQKIDSFMPSRLFIYYNERVLEGSVDSDSGATLRSGIKTINSDGVCSEDLWHYVHSQFDMRPPPAVYAKAKPHTSTSYYRVNIDLHEIKTALVHGYPVITGIMIFPSLISDEAAATGVVSAPRLLEDTLGGHAVLIVGYNDNTQQLIARNSWGTHWGDAGYFYLPYSYVDADIMLDLWVIDRVK